MRIRYTRKGADELRSIINYIRKESPQGARRVRARIRDITLLLSQHPEAGQLTSDSNYRRIVVTPYPYLIFYAAIGDEIWIIAVRHSGRSPDSMPT